jgi:hypothetical protein
MPNLLIKKSRMNYEKLGCLRVFPRITDANLLREWMAKKFKSSVSKAANSVSTVPVVPC